jgi:divinyl protochlorophyllide a 8-vinyl-reductase
MMPPGTAPPRARASRLPRRGRIGPNAIIQTNAELLERVGLVATRAVLGEAGLARSEAMPPAGMVDEDDVRRLFLAVERRHPAQANGILHAAGARTARYLLANRIPKPAQWLIRCLPAHVSIGLLLQALRRNAWTFAGSGSVTTTITRSGALLCIHACPVCREVKAERPRCVFYAGTLDGLAAALLGPHGRAREVACIACGASECAFVLEWSKRTGGDRTESAAPGFPTSRECYRSSSASAPTREGAGAATSSTGAGGGGS